MKQHIIMAATACLLCSAAWAQKKPASAPLPAGNALTRTITRQVFVADTTNYATRRLRPEGSDTSLAEFLFQRIRRGQLTAYEKNNNWSTPMTITQLLDLFKHADTIEVTDPVTGVKVNRVSIYDFSFDDIRYFSVLEEWKYDKQKGTTDIQITAIAPMHEAFTGSHSQLPMFWVKYADVKKYLAIYAAEHPNNNLPLMVWNQYFTQPLTKN